MSIELVMLPNHLILCCPLPLCLQPFWASGSFPVSQFFISGSQSIAASASVLPMSIRGCFPSELTGLISCSPRVSQESSLAPQFESINSSNAQPSLWFICCVHLVPLLFIFIAMEFWEYPFYHWWARGHFQFRSNINNAAVNIPVCIFGEQMYTVVLHAYLGVRLLSHEVATVNFSRFCQCP